MKEINKFIEIIDGENIVSIGKYYVGKNIRVGEYYLWGKAVCYKYKRGEYEYSKYDVCESYAVLERGDRFELIEGNMTSISNIKYVESNIRQLVPGHIYRVGKEIPTGYYLYKYAEKYYVKEEVFLGRGECALDMYEAHSDSRYRRERGSYGCALIDETRKHIEVKNGFAVYFGDEKFDEFHYIQEHGNNILGVHAEGTPILQNEIINIRIFCHNAIGGRFLGKAIIDLYEFYGYSVNDTVKWMGLLQPCSFHGLQDIEMDFYTLEGLCVHKCYSDFKRQYGMEYHKDTYWRYWLETSLPNAFRGKEIKVKLCKYNDEYVDEELFEFIASHEHENAVAIRDIYKSEFKTIESLLKEFENIDVEQEMKYFDKYPDLIEEIAPVLEDVLTANEWIQSEKKCDSIRFRVLATFDKKYFCAAKISDNAKNIMPIEDGKEYIITFSGEQLSEIELMSYLLSDEEKKEEVENRNYLIRHSIRYYTIEQIQNCINQLFQTYGYSSIVANSVLTRIIKNERKLMQNHIDRIYSEIVKENRVPTRWGNEYRLFSLISCYCSDAVYQYHCKWLGQQSFDIYLEERKIAIEYQGQQHYKAVEHFGGEESLMLNQQRDAKKKLLCMENGVRLLEWSYLVAVNNDNVLQFLAENKISIDDTCKTVKEINNIMAPVIQPKEKEKPPKKSKEIPAKYYIVQYDLHGNYVNRFTSIGSAAEKVGISSTSISKVLRGERNSAAYYIWIKISANEEVPEKIDVLFDASKTNSGTAKRIGKMGRIEKK